MVFNVLFCFVLFFGRISSQEECRVDGERIFLVLRGANLTPEKVIVSHSCLDM